MPRGDKSKYMSKNINQARFLEEAFEERNPAVEEAERRAWTMLNKMSDQARKASSKRSKNNLL